MKKLLSSLTFPLVALAMMFLFAPANFAQDTPTSREDCEAQYEAAKQSLHGMSKEQRKIMMEQLKVQFSNCKMMFPEEDDDVDDDGEKNGNRAGSNRGGEVRGQARAEEVQSSMIKDGDDDDTDDDDDEVKEDKDKDKNKNKNKNNNNNNGQKGNKKP